MSLFGLFAKKPAFKIDPAEGNPATLRALGLLQSGEGAALGNFYADLPPADRVHVLDGVGLMSEIGQSLPPLDSHPSMPALAGSLHYVWAHRLRGFATADMTSDTQVRDMVAMSAVAEDLLSRAAEETPGDSALHAFRIRNLMLTGGPDGAFEAISAALAASGEANVLAELARLSYLTPKWHGSTPEMHAAADEAMGRGAAFVALKARAFIEEWLYDTAMSDDPEARGAFRARLKSDAFRQEIGALDDRFRSAFNEGPRLSAAEAGFAHNNFAVLFALMGDKARLKPHLSAIGTAVFQTPWGYVAGPGIAKRVSKLRADCGLPPVPA